MVSITNTLNHVFEPLEKGLSIAGYGIPIVCSVSAIFRAALGSAQFKGGLILAGINFVGSVLAKDPRRQQELEKNAIKSLEFCAHGILNIVRAIFEFFPLVGLFTCLPYDLMNRKILRYTDVPVNPLPPGNGFGYHQNSQMYQHQTVQ